MPGIRSRWLTFYAKHVEQASKEIFGHVEKMIIATLIISAGAHVSSTDPAILLFGYLRHSFVGRGVELFGVTLLILNFLDGLYKLAKMNWHAADLSWMVASGTRHSCFGNDTVLRFRHI